MTDILEDAEEEFELPSYSTPGSILVEVGERLPESSTYKHEYSVLENTGCTYWIAEGEGFDYWLDECDFPDEGGVFVIDGIVGHYHRGEWGFTEDEVEWTSSDPRPATQAEIEEWNANNSKPQED